MVKDVTMCRRRTSSKRKAALSQIESLKSQIAEANARREAILAEQNSNAIAEGVVMDKETPAESTTTLDEEIANLGGSQEAISKIQQDVYSEVSGASTRESRDIRKRKKETLQKRIRQRRSRGSTGRASLITGMTGGKGYR